MVFRSGIDAQTISGVPEEESEYKGTQENMASCLASLQGRRFD